MLTSMPNADLAVRHHSLLSFPCQFHGTLLKGGLEVKLGDTIASFFSLAPIMGSFILQGHKGGLKA